SQSRLSLKEALYEMIAEDDRRPLAERMPAESREAYNERRKRINRRMNDYRNRFQSQICDQCADEVGTRRSVGILERRTRRSDARSGFLRAPCGVESPE